MNKKFQVPSGKMGGPEPLPRSPQGMEVHREAEAEPLGDRRVGTQCEDHAASLGWGTDLRGSTTAPTSRLSHDPHCVALG